MRRNRCFRLGWSFRGYVSWIRKEKLVPVWETLGFVDDDRTAIFNDEEGRLAVLKLLRLVLGIEVGFWDLHLALDDSRIAHAQRDLGRKVPRFVPEAWEEAMVQKQSVQVTT